MNRFLFLFFISTAVFAQNKNAKDCTNLNVVPAPEVQSFLSNLISIKSNGTTPLQASNGCDGQLIIPTELGDPKIVTVNGKKKTIPAVAKTYPPNTWSASLDYNMPRDTRAYYEVAGQPGTYYAETPPNFFTGERGSYAFFKVDYDPNGKPFQHKYTNLYVRNKKDKNYIPMETAICSMNPACKASYDKKILLETATVRASAKDSAQISMRNRLLALAKAMDVPAGSKSDQARNKFKEALNGMYLADVKTPEEILPYFQGLWKKSIESICSFCTSDSDVFAAQMKILLDSKKDATETQAATIDAEVDATFALGTLYIDTTLELQRISTPIFEQSLDKLCTSPSATTTDYCAARSEYTKQMNCLMPRPNPLESKDTISAGGLFKQVVNIPGIDVPGIPLNK